MADPATTGKLAGTIAAAIAAIKFTPASARQVLGPLLIVGAIAWLGMELVNQSATNSERLVDTLEQQTREIIAAVEQITSERAREADIIKQILDSVDRTQDALEYLRGRVDQIDDKGPYKSAVYD